MEVVSAIVAVQIAALLWVLIEALARGLNNTLIEANGDLSEVRWGDLRLALLDTLFETVLEAYRAGITLVSLISTRWTLALTMVALSVSASIFVTNGPTLIVAIDQAYSSSYEPIIVPAKSLLNSARAAFDAVAGVWNVIAYMAGVPLRQALSVVLNSDAALRPVAADLRLVVDSVTSLVTDASTYLSVTNEDLDQPLNTGFTVPMRAVGLSLLERVHDACSIDNGIVYATVRTALNSTDLDKLVYHGVNVGLSLFMAPLSAARTFSIYAGKNGRSFDFSLDPLFDHANGLLIATGRWIDAVLETLVFALQQFINAKGARWRWVPVAQTVSEFAQAGVEGARIAVNAAVSTVQIVSDTSNATIRFQRYFPLVSADRVVGHIEAGINKTVEDVLVNVYSGWTWQARFLANGVRAVVGAGWFAYDVAVGVALQRPGPGAFDDSLPWKSCVHAPPPSPSPPRPPPPFPSPPPRPPPRPSPPAPTAPPSPSPPPPPPRPRNRPPPPPSPPPRPPFPRPPPPRFLVPPAPGYVAPPPFLSPPPSPPSPRPPPPPFRPPYPPNPPPRPPANAIPPPVAPPPWASRLNAALEASSLAPPQCGVSGTLVRHISSGLCLTLLLKGDSTRYQYVHTLRECNINDDMQRFLWIQDPNFWTTKVNYAGFRMSATNAAAARRMPIGPMLATNHPQVGVSFFPLRIGWTDVTQFKTAGVPPFFKSTESANPKSYVAMRNDPVTERSVSAAGAYAVAYTDPNSGTDDGISLVYNSTTMNYYQLSGDTSPAVLRLCMGKEPSSNQLSVSSANCGAADQRWDNPCGLPGSFLRPACDAIYYLNRTSSKYFNTASYSWVPCSGSPIDGAYGGDCMTCGEPWEFKQSLYDNSTEPLIAWTAAQNIATMSAAGDGFGRGLDDWWPASLTSGGYAAPKSMTAAGQCEPPPAGKLPLPACGPTSTVAGEGLWFRLPSQPTMMPRNGMCPGFVAQDPTTPCAMEFVPQDASANWAFACPSYACTARPAPLPYLGVGKGALVTAYPAESSWESLWWWPLTPSVTQSLLKNPKTAFPTLIDYKTNADWYNLYSSYGRVLSYDVNLVFDGFLVPDFDCTYTLYLDTDSLRTMIKVQDMNNPANPLLNEQVAGRFRVPGTPSGQYYFPGLWLESGAPQDKRYRISIFYPTRRSTGQDPSTGDAAFEGQTGTYQRNLTLSWSCAGSSLGYAKQIIDGFHLQHGTNQSSLKAPFSFQSQTEEPFEYTMNTFGRAWNALTAAVPTWDRRVTAPLHGMADTVGPAISPIYSGAAVPLRFAILYVADLISSVMNKFSYVIMAIGVDDIVRSADGKQRMVPTTTCLAMLGDRPRAWMDALLESLPRMLEFVLDIKQSQGSEGEQDVCAPMEYENHILSGSLKMYYFYSEMCNTRYLNGRLTRCTMEDGLGGASHCTGFNLPYSGFSTNALCAIDDTAVSAARSALIAFRMLVDWTEHLAVALWVCLFNREQCALREFVRDTARASLSVYTDALCGGSELVIRLTGAFISFLHPAFALMYEQSGHKVVKRTEVFKGDLMKVAHYDCAAHANPATGQCRPDVGTLCFDYKTIHGRYECRDYCMSLTSETSCLAQKPTCEWLVEQCIRSDEAWMLYQSYPLEASLITLFMSALNFLTFWPAYTGYGYAQILVNLVTTDTNADSFATDPGLANSTYANSNTPESSSLTVSATASRSDYKRLLGTPRIFILRGFKATVLPVRDVVFAFYELVRAAVFVADPDILHDGAFLQFTKTLRDTVNLCELIVASITEAFIDVIETLFRIGADAVMILIDSVRLRKHLDDMIKAIFKLIKNIESMLVGILLQFFLSLPGIKDLCPVLEPIIKIIGILLSQLCNIINRINRDLSLDIPNPFCIDIPPDPCNANWNKVDPLSVYEPSPCTSNADCRTDQQFCMVSGNYTTCKWTRWSGQSPRTVKNRHDWVQPCPCNDFSDDSPDPFCNLATGFCQEGPSFFGPPLTHCPASGLDLVPTGNYQLRHSLCWNMPTWRCGKRARALYSDAAIPGVAQVTNAAEFAACRWALASTNANVGSGTTFLEGPYLCADYCSPSALNGDNRLVQITLPGGDSACACEVGIGVGSDHLFEPIDGNYSTLVLDVNSRAADTPAAMGLQPRKIVSLTGRALLGGDGEAGPPTHLRSQPTECEHEFECGAPGALCVSPWGTPLACDACPMRGEPECSAYQCSCTLPTSEAVLEQEALDATRWLGNSTCDELVRAYASTGDVRPLERDVLRACAVARRLGDAVADTSGLATLPRDIFYNPASAMWLVVSTVTALPVAWSRRVEQGGVEAAARQVGANVEVVQAIMMLSEQVYGELLQAMSTIQPPSGALDHPVIRYGVWTARLYGDAAMRAIEPTLQRVTSFVPPNKEAVTTETGRRKLLQTLVNVPNIDGVSSANTQLFQCKAVKPLIDNFYMSSQLAAFYYTSYVQQVSLAKYNGEWNETSSVTPRFPVLSMPPPPPVARPSQTRSTMVTRRVSLDAITLQDRIINFTDSVTDLDLRRRMSDAVDYVTKNEGGGRTDLQRFISDNTQCPLSTAFCQDRMDGANVLLNSTIWVGSRYLVAGTVAALVSGPLGTPLSGMLGTAAALTFPVTVLSHAYDMPIGCFLRVPPMVPVCIADDLYDLVDAYLPPQFPWPEGLWPAEDRSGEPVYCAEDDVGMMDGIRIAVYFLDSRYPSWRGWAPLYTMSLIFGSATVDSYAFYYVDKPIKTPRYEACARVMAPAALLAPALLAPALLVCLCLLQTGFVLYMKLLRLASTFSEKLRSE